MITVGGGVGEKMGGGEAVRRGGGGGGGGHFTVIYSEPPPTTCHIISFNESFLWPLSVHTAALGFIFKFSVDFRPQRPYGLFRTREPRTSTSTFTHS